VQPGNSLDGKTPKLQHRSVLTPPPPKAEIPSQIIYSPRMKYPPSQIMYTFGGTGFGEEIKYPSSGENDNAK